MDSKGIVINRSLKAEQLVKIIQQLEEGYQFIKKRRQKLEPSPDGVIDYIKFLQKGIDLLKLLLLGFMVRQRGNIIRHWRTESAAFEATEPLVGKDFFTREKLVETLATMHAVKRDMERKLGEYRLYCLLAERLIPAAKQRLSELQVLEGGI